MSQCSPRCCNRCRNEAREERKTLQKEEASVNTCRTGPFPATAEDEASDNEPHAADLPFDIEEGDRVWATGLIPEAQYIQATSTISQQLAESFAKNTEPNPTLPTGGRGSGGSVPDYVKTFGQVFSEEGFAKLPNRKPWDHAIKLVPGAEAKGCKVYPISVSVRGHSSPPSIFLLHVTRACQNLPQTPSAVLLNERTAEELSPHSLSAVRLPHISFHFIFIMA